MRAVTAPIYHSIRYIWKPIFVFVLTGVVWPLKVLTRPVATKDWRIGLADNNILIDGSHYYIPPPAAPFCRSLYILTSLAVRQPDIYEAIGAKGIE